MISCRDSDSWRSANPAERPSRRTLHMIRAVPALLAIASGIALGLTFSPHGGAVLPFLALAPLGAALTAGGLRRRAAGPEPHPRPPPSPVVLGILTATIAYGIGLLWMIPALSWRSALAFPAWILISLIGGLAVGAGCGAASLLSRRLPLPLALAACWTGVEWALAHLPGMRLAWLTTGASLAWEPVLAAGVELSGGRLLTLWTVAVGVWIGGVATKRGAGIASWRTLAGVAVALAPLAWGLVRQEGPGEAGDEILTRVAAVQPGREIGDPLRWLEALRDRARREPFDLVVFPEGFVQHPAEGVAELARTLDRPVVTGILDREVVGAAGLRDTLWYNAAIVQPAAAPRSPSYRKMRLVPGMEAAGPWPSQPGGVGYRAGSEARPLPVGGRPVGVMICYDSAFPEVARALVQAGADWLLVLSDDDWFDPARPFRTSWAYWQHATHGRLRAQEHRIGLLQAGATGFTFAVTPEGRGDAFALDPGEAGVRVLALARGRGPTLFTRIGDLTGMLCFAFLATGVVLAVWRRRFA